MGFMASELLTGAAHNMKHFSKTLRAIGCAIAHCLTSMTSWAQTATTAAPTTEQRLAALEAYVTNSDPGKSLTGVAGPGHNAWMMTSAALVLFMTLPGLALFYGGLVRQKNVLSILAQCLALAGIVTLLW